MSKKRRAQSVLEYGIILVVMSMMAIYTLSTNEFLKAYIKTVHLTDQSSKVETKLPPVPPAPPTILKQPTDP